MRTQIDLVSRIYEWSICGLSVLVATAGKFGGTSAAARITGLGWRDAAGQGLLMNTRGLMELIVLNVGLDLGVISPTLFTMLVVIGPGDDGGHDADPAAVRASAGPAKAGRYVLVKSV
jgi:Kef-type K+ transport system membrane component KefB